MRRQRVIVAMLLSVAFLLQAAIVHTDAEDAHVVRADDAHAVYLMAAPSVPVADAVFPGAHHPCPHCGHCHCSHVGLILQTVASSDMAPQLTAHLATTAQRPTDPHLSGIHRPPIASFI